MHWSKNTLRIAALSATALVSGSPLVAQERIAQDPHDSLRAANEAYLKQVEENCTSDVQSKASMLCPQGCMISIPNTKLPVADSCDPRTWTCAWPEQPVGEDKQCPAGWTGNYHQDHWYQLQNCGKTTVDTGKTKVLTVGCTRARVETRTDPCPSGQGWTGSGATYSRTHYEKLETDLTTVTETSVTDWALVGNVDCKRDITRQNWQACLAAGSASCYTDTVTATGAQLATTCGRPADPVTTWTNIGHQHLANDLVTVVTDSFDANINTQTGACYPDACPYLFSLYNTAACGLVWDQRTSTFVDCGGYCPPPPTGEGIGGDSSGGAVGGGDGDGGSGDGGCPFVIDMDGTGVDITGYQDSNATFNFSPAPESKPVKTAWYSPKEAIVARDYNHNGKIDGISEVFGGKDVDGFAVLQAREDTNHDGKIDKTDTGWAELRLWYDTNGNGQSDPGELFTLDEKGVVMIDLASHKVSIKYADAYIPAQGTVTMKDGTKRTSSAVFFTNDSAKKAKAKTPTK